MHASMMYLYILTGQVTVSKTVSPVNVFTKFGAELSQLTAREEIS